MDNSDSSPALTFPNVPDDFCPTGNWKNVFQAFIDEVLSNGTILVPGLGDVTPQEIITINQNIQNLENQVEALDTLQIRRGVFTGVGSADSTVPIVFDSNMTTSDYTVTLTPVLPSSPITAASPNLFLLNGTKAISDLQLLLKITGLLQQLP